VLKIQSGGWPSILKQDCLTTIISVWGINISLRVIEDAERRVAIQTFSREFREKNSA
jgi:hypothetical protein